MGFTIIHLCLYSTGFLMINHQIKLNYLIMIVAFVFNQIAIRVSRLEIQSVTDDVTNSSDQSDLACEMST